MKRLSSYLLPLALAGSAFAQCPADPTTLLAGKWTFQITTGAKIVGSFTLVPGSFRFQTNFATQSGESISPGGIGGGSYAFRDINCTQGILNFNNVFGPAGGGLQANFFVTANAQYGRILVLRSTSNFGLPPFPSPYVDPTDISRYTQLGNAWPAPTACPAGVTPVNSLNGTYNSVTMSGITGGGLAGQMVIGSANLGFQPSYLDPRGVLTMFLNAVPPTLPQAPPPAPLPVVSRNGDPGQFWVESDCGSGNMWIYFAWPRPYNIIFYSRLRTSGAIDYVGLGYATFGNFATTDVAIAR